MPAIDLSILNQRQTPAFYADILANRPAAGFIGRIFVSTNTFAFFRDNGTSWDLIGGPGTGTVTGTGANGQVTYWNGASTITGSNDLFFDSVNGHLGIGTIIPGTALDVKHDQSTVVQLEQITATNDIRIAFINSGVGLWRLGAFYNAGANDFGLFDIAAATQPVTVKRTTGQVLIGTSTVGSGKLVVASTTGDNGVQIVGAAAPSLRIDNAESGPTKRAGFGISTATNNFIQGSADRDFCMFNGSTTASPILFGIYDTTNVVEAARISSARNFLVGTTTDGGQRLQISGSVRATQYYLDSMTAGNGALYYTSTRVTLANYNVGGSVLIEVNGGNPSLLLNSNASATFSNVVNINNATNVATLSIANSGGGNNMGLSLQNTGAGGSTFYIWPTASINGEGANKLIFGSIANNQIISLNNGSGNVAVGGVSDNGKKLQINGDVSVPNNNGYFINRADGTIGQALFLDTSNNLNVGFGVADSIRFATFLNSVRMTIKSTGVINMSAVPTSSAGLVSGDIYSVAGVLNIVP
jgi:hypothetical protein